MNTDSDIKIIKSIMKEWEHLPNENIKFQRLGGLTNYIWKVNAVGTEDKTEIIYRIFGNGCSAIDRNTENYIFEELSNAGIGPKCYGKNEFLRVEQYFDSRELCSEDMHDDLTKIQIAKNLASLHRVHMNQLDKTPMFKTYLEEKKFVSNIKEYLNDNNISDTLKATLHQLSTLITEEELEFLESNLPKSKSSVVFSHNDLHARNILKLNSTDQLIFIDYEYGSYNYRGYDIANLFIESMIDYEVESSPYFKFRHELEPSESELKKFIKFYLLYSKLGSNEEIDENKLTDPEYFDQILTKIFDINEFNDEMEEIYREVQICLLYSNFYWIIWSIEKTQNPSTNFDYLQFAVERFDLYCKMKKCLF